MRDVRAAQLDNLLDTQSFSVQWLPTTGEFGLWNAFGDYDDHPKVRRVERDVDRSNHRYRHSGQVSDPWRRSSAPR
jgi:hypothetical protein